MGHEVAPRGPAGRCRGSLDDLEVLGPVGVGADEQPLAGPVQFVAQARFAPRHEARGGVAPPEIHEVVLGGVVAVNGNDREIARAQAPDRHEPAGIGLVQDECVLGDLRAEPVAVDPARAVIVVQADVQERSPVREPDGRSFRVGHAVGPVAACGDVADPDRVEFGAFPVGAPGQQAVVGGVLGPAQVEEGSAGRERVAVDHHGLVAAAARPPAQQGVLAPVAVALIVLEGPVRDGHVAVLLLDPGPHLPDHALAQAAQGGEHRFRVGVLGLQHGPDLGRQDRRIAQNLLPVVGPQPRVGIADRDAVNGRDPGADRDGTRRLGVGKRQASGAGHRAHAASSSSRRAVPFMQ